MNKIYANVDEAVADIPVGAVIGLGGFFACGTPISLTRALARRGVRDLTIVAESIGVGNIEVNELVENGQVRKIISSYPFYRSMEKGNAHLAEQLVRAGAIEVEVYSMGTFVEKLRAGGAGIPAFYTPTGAGTVVSEGKETRVFDGRECVLETAIKLDFALVHACKGDCTGNLSYRKTARNFNPVMAISAAVTIAEIEKMVEVGELDSERIATPGIYVKRIVEVGRVAAVAQQI